MRKRLEALRARLADQLAALRHASPRLRLANASARLQARETHLSTLMRKRLVALNSRLNVAAGRLNTVSPLATLQRGYAIVTNAAGAVVTNAQTLEQGDMIEARLAQGSVRARIEGGSNG
jgi:exodeoxyribonuclease VII large subunit